MSAAFQECPKCGRSLGPPATPPPEKCPSCGLYFAKWATRADFVPPSRRRKEADTNIEDEPRWRDQLLDCLLHVPREVSSAQLGGRAAILLFLLVWGVRMGLMDYRTGEMGQSFMHHILLPIHEAGHIIFIPCGEFMAILGGSLFQILFPLIIAGALLWTNRDAFGGAVGLWWASVSLVDLAPYIYDAKAPQLILLGGNTGEDGPHDWIYLLGYFGKVHHSQAYGAWAHHFGFAAMLLALAFATWALKRWYTAREGAGF